MRTHLPLEGLTVKIGKPHKVSLSRVAEDDGRYNSPDACFKPP